MQHCMSAGIAKSTLMQRCMLAAIADSTLMQRRMPAGIAALVIELKLKFSIYNQTEFCVVHKEESTLGQRLKG